MACVPLFVEEITKSVLESKLLRDDGNPYELVTSLPALAIPTTLQDSLMARLDHLASGGEVAQLGVALGRQFSFELIAAVARRDRAALQSDLDTLVKSELLFQKGFGTQASYLFKHALIQDAAYQTLLKTSCQQIHRRVTQLQLVHRGLRHARPKGSEGLARCACGLVGWRMECASCQTATATVAV